MERNKLMRQTRSLPCEFQTRDDNGEMVIEGYFAVFNSNYEIAPGLSESIAPGAFTSSMGRDVRALVNHDTTLVLGRTTAHTCELREDSHGLYAKVLVNPKDSAAVDAYERVKRGDVSQCSIGFNVIDEEIEFREDGSVHWTIKDVELWEVSVCTFPAYEATNISARERQRDEAVKRQLDARRAKALAKLKGEDHGTESPDAQEED